ncbi:MAG TPA: TAXI family TRAP transporter solute-binding subunit [Candidatus Binatia bacterium]
MAIKRYNAGIQRAKGLLEIASALYDSSLSHQTQRAAEGTLQTDTRVGRVIRLSLGVKTIERTDIPVSFATGSFPEIIGVAQGTYSLAWINPSAMLTMAYRGKGVFKKRLPLRTIATFPSFDVMGFAVHESTGITSLAQIKRERIPLRVSTGFVPKSDLTGSATMFTVAATLKAAGFSLADVKKWGGKINSVPRPSDPRRRAAIENGSVNAIFDEGIKSWGQTALDSGFRYLPVDGPVLRQLKSLGYRASAMSRCGFSGMTQDVPTIDFSGWPMIVHADLPNDVAYALCEAIELRKDMIPTDNFKPLSMRQLCANDDEAPFDVPLHPGARRFYRERGVLK